MKAYLFFLLAALSLCPAVVAADEDVSPVIIDYFYEPNSSDCVRVQEQIFPELQERFETFYTINKYDIGIETNIMRESLTQRRRDAKVRGAFTMKERKGKEGEPEFRQPSAAGKNDGKLVFLGIIIGVMVTALESVCTGQVLGSDY